MGARHRGVRVPSLDGDAVKHKCPPWCHLCPLIDGAVMPQCMGTAAMSHGDRDMSYCTCTRDTKPDRIASIEHRLCKIEEQLRGLYDKDNRTA